MLDQRENNQLIQQQALFTSIASRYDFINHMMTGWQDIRWRRYAVNKLQLPPSALLLDIGSGNGQILRETSRQYPDCQSIAADLTSAMMEIGRERNSHLRTSWAGADAAYLPFQNNTYDGVISGFLVRNLSDVIQGLKDQYRVLKPGGRIAVLDTTKPGKHLLTPLIRFYMTKVIPTLGGLITGQKEAYTYLYDSTNGFLRAEELAATLAAVGFMKVAYRQFAFGMITVHWGEK